MSSPRPLLERFAESLTLRDEPAEFVRQRFGVEPDPMQAAMLNDRNQYIGMVWGRQTGKTTGVSFKAAHFGAVTPGGLCLIFAPSEQQSINLLARCKPYLYNAGVEIDVDNRTEIRFRNGSELRALPGSQKTVRGWSGPGMLIVDEAAFAPNELWEAVEPMIAVSGGQVILLSSADATFGFFYEIMTGDDPHWSRYKVTAYDCPRYNRDWLEWKRATLPDRVFKREYLAEFVDPTGIWIPEHMRQRAHAELVDPLDTDAPESVSRAHVEMEDMNV